MIFDNFFRKEERFYIIRRKMEQEMELFLKASGWGGDRSKRTMLLMELLVRKASTHFLEGRTESTGALFLDF